MPRKQCTIFAIRELDTGIVRSVSITNDSYFGTRNHHKYTYEMEGMSAYSSPLYTFTRSHGGFGEFECTILESVLSVKNGGSDQGARDQDMD